MMHDLRMKLNPASAWKKQHSTRLRFDQNVGLKFMEEVSRAPH